MASFQMKRYKLNSFAAYMIAQIWPREVNPIRDCVRVIVQRFNLCDKMMIYEALTGRGIVCNTGIVIAIGGKQRESYYCAQYIRDDDDPMWLACEQGSIGIVKWLSQSWQIDESCLLVAAHRGHVSVCAWILATRWLVMFDKTDKGVELRNHVTKHMRFSLDGLNRAVDAGVRARGGDPIRQRPRDPMLQWLFDNGYTTSDKIEAGMGTGSVFDWITAGRDPREYERVDVELWRHEQGLPHVESDRMLVAANGPMSVATATLNERIKEIIASRGGSFDDLLK
jgi:hypothetical protein